MAVADEIYDPIDGCCNSCRHYDRTAFGTANYGHCRRYPPIAIETQPRPPPAARNMAGGGLRRQLRRIPAGLKARLEPRRPSIRRFARLLGMRPRPRRGSATALRAPARDEGEVAAQPHSSPPALRAGLARGPKGSGRPGGRPLGGRKRPRAGRQSRLPWTTKPHAGRTIPAPAKGSIGQSVAGARPSIRPGSSPRLLRSYEANRRPALGCRCRQPS